MRWSAFATRWNIWLFGVAYLWLLQQDGYGAIAGTKALVGFMMITWSWPGRLARIRSIDSVKETE